MVNIKINNIPLAVEEGTTILQAAKQLNIDIPTLCYLKEINEIGACRVCVVEVKGARSLVASCVHPVSEGMEIFTNTPKVMDARRKNLELVLSTHDKRCLSCAKSKDCELQKLCKDYGVADEDAFQGERNKYDLEETSAHMIRDNNKCILCRRCVAACSKTQGIAVEGPINRGFKTHIGCAFGEALGDSICVSCGQCIVVCPTGALMEKDQTQEVWEALADPTKHVIVQTAPSIRVTLGEGFGMPIGSNVKGKMVAALKRLGFDGVYDCDVAADLTIMEEANELLDRIKNNGPLPLFTSCSPGWVKYCEHNYPEFLPNLSSCKSPQQMFGAIAKTWYAERNNIDPKDIFVVSIMPCTAKKFECGRDDQSASGYADVDVALTTRELIRMIDRAGIDFKALPDEEFDAPLGIATGAGVIFGATGGVMEAALRTAVETLTGEELKKLEFEDVRGVEGIKKATYNVAGMDINVAIASGLANAKELMEKIKSGEENFHFVEVMACPGGCVNGGGQPTQPASVRNFVDVRAVRAKSLYQEDENLPIRKSHENPVIKEIYDTYLEKPGSHKAHEILHTTYVERKKF